MVAVRFAMPRLKFKATADEVFEALLSSALRHFETNAQFFAEGGSDPEVLHQIRVALRRLRNLLGFFAPMADDQEAAVIRAELKTLYDALAAARELDVVLREGLWMRVAAAAEGVDQPPERYRSARRRAYRKARASLAVQTVGDQIRRLLASRSRADTPLAARPFAVQILETRLRKVLRLGRRYDHLSDHDRHRFRRRLKTFRLAFESFVPFAACGDRARDRLARRLSHTLDRLGRLNDLESAWISGPKAPDAVRDAAAILKAGAEPKARKSVRRLLKRLEALTL
jgi:triphosphatase